MRKRADDDFVDDADIKAQRKSFFDWTALLLPNVPVIIKALLLLGIGAGGAVTIPDAVNSFTSSDTPTDTVPAGGTVAPDPNAAMEAWRAQADLALQSHKDAIDAQARADAVIRARIEELKDQIEAAERRSILESNTRDDDQDKRIADVEALVQ